MFLTEAEKLKNHGGIITFTHYYIYVLVSGE